MEQGFVRGQSDNLPKVDLPMIFNYLSENPLYPSKEIRGVKLSKSARPTYGDDAIGYVQLKRTGNQCTVKARVTPEHKVKSKPYHCTFICDEESDEIKSIECTDCAASKGGCKHAIALVMWLYRRSEEPSCTSVKCYWAKAKLSTIGTSLKFIAAEDITTVVASRKPNNPAVTNKKNNNDKSFLAAVVEKSRDLKIDSQLMRYHKILNDNDPKNLSLHILACKYKKMVANNFQSDGFVQFCKSCILDSQCLEVTKATTDQSDCSLWYQLRYGRITASKAHEIAYCVTKDGVLVEYVLGAYSFKDTIPIKRGKLLEDNVRGIVGRKKKFTIKKCGLFINKDFPIIGASPDGLSSENVVEIKCPINKKNLKKYVNNGRLMNKYLGQIQIQMFLAKKSKGLFCLAHDDFETTNNIDIYNIDFDDEYCHTLIAKGMEFWKENIFEKILML